MPSETLEFQIEQIYSSRISEDGETEYHIKWAGFDKSESTWESENNLKEDGLGDYLTEYENNNKKSSTKKKKSSRTKTPVKKTTKKAKTSKKKATPKPKKSSTKKKATPKPKKSSTKKKQRTKTPPPSSSRGKKTKKAESESEDEDAEEEADDAVIAFANSNAGKHTSSNNDTSASLFGSSIFYWSGPYIFFSAIVLYTMLFFADEYKFPCITDKDATTTCDQQKATFILYIEWLQIIASGLAPLIAYFGIMKHPQSNNTLFSKKIATGVVWFFAFIALPFCTVANKDHVRLKWATQSCNIMSSVSFTMAFMSSSDYSSVKPTWNVKRVLPFCIIGYYLFTELFRSGSSDNSIQPGLLRVHYEQMENDSISFVLFALEIAVPLLLGWAAASRVGYGGIEWRSLRATKQTLGVIGCLFILFNLMIRVNEQVILPLNLSALMLDRLQFVCQTMAIGLLATSALLHADEE